MTGKKEFTVTVYMQNRTGVLNRVSIIFSRRRVNIESLNVTSSEMPGIKKVVFVLSEAEEAMRKIIRQIEKQIDVLQVYHHINSPVSAIASNN
ncbi:MULTISPECIES: acetolactate synthase small subunit [Chryseobacterium]|uniref:Acetolactate synthase small subunit n=2 Tax=Chryseobacterium TaxID=59732 RepID=A0A6N4X651_9FLAO|nr:MULTISPECIES: acetolactate synthase small subunit [Chryseobacterium]RMZ58668.1 acetolactate synthase small subunit [Chryseobacterium nematophagum]CAA7193760.1 Acetolactate synthase small subunit [Chryseobacterium potabilaquae]